ncbi:hypothetical protein SA496_15625 [Pseudomonas sp. JS3066]|jgi:hypothetical protein|uniref:hypothetical protein n=1 Tax=Pseudomonas sp. JS3066 TaxID=3090665 RepID=UPI002E7BDF68|nr:hypothetical protein [Pseudomonas sp. JS3066]WVK91158.1 hypothetical protein SA496_15625 [Pseudomonas sp. JS3066]
MAEQLRIRPVRDSSGAVCPHHWRTNCGYTVIPCRSFAVGFGSGLALIRKGDDAPFAYVCSEPEAYALIQADKAASGVSV